MISSLFLGGALPHRRRPIITALTLLTASAAHDQRHHLQRAGADDDWDRRDEGTGDYIAQMLD